MKESLSIFFFFIIIMVIIIVIINIIFFSSFRKNYLNVVFCLFDRQNIILPLV